MSRENVEVVRRGYKGFVASGDVSEDIIAPDFVWDMSTFRGWPERQTYEGIEGTRKFMRDWLEAWDEWSLDVVELHDAGDDKVVAIMRQRGRSKTTGLTVDMTFGQVWTIRDGKEARMEMYAEPADALEAVGPRV
jgi:ketosteroid isomerase-like protein